MDRGEFPARAVLVPGLHRGRRGTPGIGVGSALIEHGLAFARRDGTPAFLETGRPGNVPYYERRGFRTYLDEDAPNGGPHIWFMRFDP